MLFSVHRVLIRSTVFPRQFSVQFHQASNPGYSIYISKSTNPYFNLTLEDWLFRHKNPNEPLLLIYRDEPCVVIGRNQNPWSEVNMSTAKAMSIPWIRRRSGGGTVYHDLGNTNFSIHLPRAAFDRHATAQVILKAVRALDIDAYVNDRNDICVDGRKMSYCPVDRHSISGSAYKIVNKRAYHHGTMLISTRLEILGDILRPNKETMVTRGVPSVRSPVCNLQQFNPQISHESFARAVIQKFREEYSTDEEVHYLDENEEIKSIDYIKKGMDELITWNWMYGQTPEFTYTVRHSFSWGDITAEIHARHGLITDCLLEVSNTALKASSVELLANLGTSLKGKRYGLVQTKFSDDSLTGELGAWLRRVMET